MLRCDEYSLNLVVIAAPIVISSTVLLVDRLHSAVKIRDELAAASQLLYIAK